MYILGLTYGGQRAKWSNREPKGAAGPLAPAAHVVRGRPVFLCVCTHAHLLQHTTFQRHHFTALLSLQELRRLHMAHMCRTGAPGTGFRVRCFVFAASEEPLTPEAALGGT
jgi:hypothetical protein